MRAQSRHPPFAAVSSKRTTGNEDDCQRRGFGNGHCRRPGTLFVASIGQRRHLDRLLVEAFALVREAARRKLNMRHFDVQLLGGAAVHHRSIVELQTGRLASTEALLRWNDPDLGINWGVMDATVSAKDQVLPLLKDFVSPF